jgi:hypothetical protein
LTLSDCTISGNTAGSDGGGLDNQGTAKLVLTNCTVSGNSAGVHGGGLGNLSTAKLTACTVSANSTKSLAGGFFNEGTATLTDTIIAANTGPGDASDIAAEGTLSGTFNLIGIGGSGGLSNGKNHNIVLNTTNFSTLGLAPLGSYGGPTETMALLPGSPALGAGTAASGVTADQRAFKLDTSDPGIGAYQSQGFTVTVKSGTPQSATVEKNFASPLSVVVTANDPSEPVAGGLISFAAPSSGASAVLSRETATISANGVASVTAAANSTAGAYTVSASIPGVPATADFLLTNTGATVTLETPILTLNKKHKVTKVKLVAKVAPAAAGGAVPTGTVDFEIVYSNTTPDVFGKATLKHGTATLTISKPSIVLNESIEVVYNGNSKIESSVSPPLLIT